MTADDLQKFLQVRTTEQLVYLPYGNVKKADGSKSVSVSNHSVVDIEDLVPDRATLLLNNTFDSFLNGVLIDEKKVVALYLGQEERVDLVYKLVASNEELRQYITFGTCIDPPTRLLAPFGLSTDSLPRIGGLVPGVPQGKDKQVQHPMFLFPSQKPSYPELVEFLKAVHPCPPLTMG